jgi:6-phosphogluconolactonase (cycloisomerase 2 family)
MKLARFVALGLSLPAAALAISPAAASAAQHDRGAAHRGNLAAIVGQVYVNDNTAPENTIAGFNRHADGSLTPISGSPFPAGGVGTGAGIGSQGALQESADGRYLLAVDAGSNQISVLRVRPDGSLKSVEGSPVFSGGVEPASIAVHGSLVYVANSGKGGTNYTGFRLNGGGRLRAIEESTVTLPEGSTPGDVLFNSTGTTLVGVRVATSLIDSFAVARNGRLSAAAGSPFTAQGAGPFGSEFRPTNPAQLFVSNAHGGENAGTVSAFSVAGDATLTSIGASPFPDNQTAPCWVEISRDGEYLFTVNTASDSVSSYAITTGGSLGLIGSTTLHTPAAGPFDARLAPDGQTLFVVQDRARSIAALAVEGGSLSELASSPAALPEGSAPFGIVVD